MPSDKMGGSQMASEKMGGSDKMGMGGDNTKINVDVDVTINVIQWSMGGGSAMQNVAPPSMAAGMTHQVCGQPWILLRTYATNFIRVTGYSRRDCRKGFRSQLDNGQGRRYGPIQLQVHEPYSHSINIPSTLCQDGWWKGFRFYAQRQRRSEPSSNVHGAGHGHQAGL